MKHLNDTTDDAISRDIEVLADFMEIYCQGNHAGAGKHAIAGSGTLSRYLSGRSPLLCDECGKLLLHGAAKRLLCPYDPKPRCKKCETHCYAPGYRERIREVMRYSGMQLIKRGRIDLLKKYFF